MKIFTANQIRELDRFTIENEPVSSFDLMERAAMAALSAFPKGREFDGQPVFYFCGKGNNGGDGLVMARIMAEKNERAVAVIVLEHRENGSMDFGKNLYHLQGEENVAVIHVKDVEELPEIPEEAIIVDAILGSGLARPLEGFLADVVEKLNQLGNYKVSIDMPTGLYGEDNAGNDLSKAFRSDLVITFHCPKLSLLLPDTGWLAADFRVVDIGLITPPVLMESPYWYVGRGYIQPYVKKRLKFSHKGSYGHGLLLSGSRGKMGAAQLASYAAMRTGLGLITVHTPGCGLDIMQIGVPEAMCSVDSEAFWISEVPKLGAFNAVAIGPGIGVEQDTANALKQLIQDVKVPLVIDADALNILSENKTWLSFLPKSTVLTPHPKEFERLAGSWKSDFERLQLQMDFSKKFGVVVVLKGAHTSISTRDGHLFFNSTGNPGMATAGSGDVLTGVILALLAQGYSPEFACIYGVYLHGVAGDIAEFSRTDNALIASDIVESLSLAYRETVQDMEMEFPFLEMDEDE